MRSTGWSATIMSRGASLVSAALVGLGAALAAVWLAGLPRRTLVLLLAGLALLWIALLSRRPKTVFVFAWVLALTYNRNYFLFDRILGDHGSQGLYVLPADALLAILYALWLLATVLQHRVSRPMGPPVWPWLLPFLGVCALSSLLALRIEWATFEMVRLIKFGLVLLYVRYNFKRPQWWAAVAALGLAIALQSTYGVVQVVGQGRFNVGTILGTATDVTAELQEFREQVQQEWYRAAGTLGHPNTLAPYLLLSTPVFLALGFPARARPWRWSCRLVGLLGLCGIAVTLSRVAWLLSLIEVIILGACLTVSGMISAKRTISILVGLAALVIVPALPLADRIFDRLTHDLAASVEFRAQHNRIALNIFQRAPFLGVGLNHFPYYLNEYDPELEEFLEDAEIVRRGIHFRVIAAVHNLYLLLLAETGVFGLAAFLLFLLGALASALRAAILTSGAWRAVSIGLMVGMLGVLGHQFTEFSLWTDPVLYTFALAVGLVRQSPALQHAAPAPGRVSGFGTAEAVTDEP